MSYTLATPRLCASLLALALFGIAYPQTEPTVRVIWDEEPDALSWNGIVHRRDKDVVLIPAAEPIANARVWDPDSESPRPLGPEEKLRYLPLSPGRRLFVSPALNRVGVATFLASGPDEPGSSFRDLDAEELGLAPQPDSVVERYYPSDDGEVYVAYRPGETPGEPDWLWMHDRQGKLQKVERPVDVRQIFVGQSRRVVVTTGDRILWFEEFALRAEVPLIPDEVESDGDWVAVLGEDEVVFLKQGLRAGALSTEGVARDVAFSTDGEPLALVVDTSSHYLVQLSPPDVSIIWEGKVSSGQGEYRSVAIAPGSRLFALGSLDVQSWPNRKNGPKNGNARAFIHVLDGKGSRRFVFDYVPSRWNRRSPELWFWRSGGRLLSHCAATWVDIGPFSP